MLAINPKIKQKAEDIRKKIFGTEVRESLASGIEAISEDVEATIGRQDYVEEQFQNVIDETTDKDVISAPELIAARNGKSNLKTRLDDEHAQVTAQLQQTEQSLNAQLAQTNSKVDLLNRGLGETFATLADLQTAYPTGDTKDHIVAADGHRYYWNDTAWADGGAYQAIELDEETKVILSKTDKAVDETLLIADFLVNKSNRDTAIFTHPTQSWYGWKNGFKPISFRKIVLTDTVVTLGSTYKMDIMDASSNILYSKTEVATTTGSNQKITFDFGRLIKMDLDFYISVKSSEFVSFIAAESYNNKNVVSNTLMTSGWLNGTSWSALNNFSHVLILDFYRDSFKVDFSKVDGLLENGLGASVLTDKGQYKTLDVIANGEVTKNEFETIAPRHLYSVRNDLNKNRNYPTTIYVDHTIKAPNFNLDINFPTGDYKKSYYSGPLTTNKETESISIPYKTRTYDVTSFSSVLRKVKLSASANVVPKVLVIGDSNVYGDQNTDFANNKINLVSKLKQFFEMDKIDNGGVGGGLLLGETNKYTYPINYKGQTYEIDACTSGRSGWTAYGINGHTRNYYPNQTNWDLLGLGNGSKTDYIGSQSQIDLFSQTKQNTSMTINNKDHRMLTNAYFDNEKTGDTKFSLAKYIERYRTMDDDGNRLTLSNGTGTQITSDNITEIDVCTPTHVILQLGQNDLSQNVSVSAISDNVRNIVNSIKYDYPNVIVIVALPDQAGTIFSVYGGWPLFDCRMTRGSHDKFYDLTKKFMTEFSESEEQENVFYCPNYFTQSTVDGMSYNEVIDPVTSKIVGKVKSDVNGPDAHPSWHACADWAYQMYSLIRWTL